MSVYALQTARAGSESVPNKNMLECRGKPLYLHNFQAAIDCPLIDETFITTDIPEILEGDDRILDGRCIQRPDHLKGSRASHYETIMHGLKVIELVMKEEADILVILLGNSTGAARHDDLAFAIDKLKSADKFDSCMSVSEYNMFNPYRAFEFNGEWDNLETYVPQEHIKKQGTIGQANNKDAFGDVYFFNGSFWICKREALISNDGLLPFPWLGKMILPYFQPEGVMELDAHWQIDHQ